MSLEHRRYEWEQELAQALVQGDADAVASLLAQVHAADLALFFAEQDTADRIALLDALTDEQAAELLDELDPVDRSSTLDLLSLERTSDILEEMPSDEAADLLAELPTKEADALIERMEPDIADDVVDLLRYPEHSAGGLMAKEFVQVGPDDTVAHVLALLRRHHDDAEMIYYLYVLDEEERLLGVVTLRKLIISTPDIIMADIMAREFVSVTPDMPQEEVAALVLRHNLLAVPVLNADGRMQGIITVDDVGDVVQEEAADDLLEMSGSEEHREAPRPWPQFRGWRSGLLALAGGLVAAILIRSFSPQNQDWTALVALLPLLLVLSITAGNQSALAIDLAHDDAIERGQLGRIFAREVLAGLLLAIIGGLLAGLFTAALHRRVGIVLPVTVPMTAGVWTAAIIGAVGALALRDRGDRLGPAAHTGVVVISLLVAVSVYLLLAR